MKSTRPNKSILVLLCLIFIWSTPPSFAQVKSSQFDNFTFYDQRNGLLGKRTYKVIEDSGGFIWIGTQSGVSRFDGSRFTNFQHYQKEGEIHEMGPILDLKIDFETNRLWASGDRGIFTTLMDEISFLRPEDVFNFNGFPSDRVESLLLDDQGVIWTANYMTGLSKVDLVSRSVTNYRLENSTYIDQKNINRLKYIAKDPDENILWIATESGIVKFDCTTSEYSVYTYANDPEQPQNILLYLFADQKNVYLGSANHGLLVFQKATQNFKKLIKKTPEPAYNRTLDFFYDQGQYLWVTTTKELIQYDLVNNQIHSRFNHEISRSLLKGVSLIDSRGTIWYRNDNGLFRYDPLTSKAPFIELEKRSFLEKPMEVKEIIYSNGFFYVLGLRSSGLYQINASENTYEVYSLDQSEDFNFRDMVQMNDDRLLIATFNNLYFFNIRTKTFTLASLQLNHPHPAIQTLAKDSLNRFWVGTNMAGLFCLDFKENSVQNYTAEFDTYKKENYRWIQNMYVDSKNNLWMGKGSNTVFNQELDSIQCLPPEDTMIRQYAVVTGFQEDHNKNLWMAAHEEGLGFTSMSQFNEGITHIEDGYFTGVYDFTDSTLLTVGHRLGEININTHQFQKIPLLSTVVNPVLQGPVVGNGKGKYLIGSNNGVLVYEPDKLESNYDVPIPYIQKISVNNQSFFNGENLGQRKFRLNRNTDYFTINVSALGYHNAEKTTLEYKLHQDWIELGGENQISLTDVRPGIFTLELKACNFYGACTSKPVKYTIEVLPAFYQTWWAYLGYVLLIIGVLYSLYRFRLSRKLEQQEALRLQELDQFKTRFYSNITHEFRTPLTVIRGMAEELENQIEEESSEKIHLIKSNSAKLLDLVNQMLALSKAQAGKMELVYEQEDAINFIRYLVESHSTFAKLKNIGLLFHSEEQEFVMDIDTKKLERIISNLLSNAIKFSPEYGKILVVVKAQKTHLQVDVIDNGVGISPEHLPMIFDRFHQEQSNRGQQGSGIGLAMVNELVKLMQGKVEVVSQEGKGSTFSVFLPIHKNAPPRTFPSDFKYSQSKMHLSPDLTSLVEGDHPILLLIEDNIDVAYYIKTCLNKEYQLTHCRNGKEGFKVAVEIIPDIVISDVMMPEMDGFELCQLLKTDERTNHIPVILLTARATQEDKLTGLGSGADAYLTKPFNKEELITRLAKLLEIRATLQAKNRLTNASIVDSGSSAEDIHPFINKLETIILENIEEDLSIDQLAGYINLSTSQVYRKIKALTGLSTSIFVRSVRLKRAKHYLNDPELTITDVSYLTGFSSPTYFSQVFKETFGQSPSSFKKNSGS